MFTDAEIEFLDSQILARIATVNSQGQPDVAPIGLHRDGDRFLITGHDLPATLKYRNVKSGNRRIALVIDDQPSVKPWVVRGIKLHGSAEIVNGESGPAIVFTPLRKWSWGID
jgi:pyridoxamine 5'-phosphate oxidase family protein